MTFRVECHRLLGHLGRTTTIEELDRDPSRADAVGLRHDVDHDLDLALELAHLEHSLGMRATYFLRHDHPYASDPALADKAHQLVEYGHEVGIHVNALVQWMSGEVQSPADPVASFVARLRGAGVRVVGAAAHGDRRCYELRCSNAWLWSEDRGPDPAARERGCSAEGIAVQDPRWQVPYPAGHAVQRPDGRWFPLWSISRGTFGLRYEACRVPVDRYWSDSGGEWTRSGDPMDADLRRGRHQVLMHPIWWRAPPRTVFILSTARSATKWLVSRLSASTNAEAFHEWTLNHRRAPDGPGYVPEKRTHEDFRALEEQPGLVRSLLAQAAAHHSARRRDVVEANVYLAAFLGPLRDAFPDALFVHLHRDPGAVVRSILDRDWHAVPDDRRRPRAPVAEWAAADQFTRCCLYWRDFNERLMATVPPEHRHATEGIVADAEAFAGFARSIGLVVHPRLLGRGHGARVDVGPGRVPPVDRWPPRYRAVLERTCGRLREALAAGDRAVPGGGLGRHAATAATMHHPNPRGARTFWTHESVPGRAVGASARRDAHGHLVIAPDGACSPPNAHLVLSEGFGWASGPPDGSPTRPGDTVEGWLEVQSEGLRSPRLFLLFFGPDGAAVARRQVRTLRGGAESVGLCEPMPAGAAVAALAVHLGVQDSGGHATIRSGVLRATPVAPDYRARFLPGGTPSESGQ